VKRWFSVNYVKTKITNLWKGIFGNTKRKDKVDVYDGGGVITIRMDEIKESG
jgi:hypothetical protein